MSFLFGGGGSKVKPKYTGIQLQTASQTAALTIAWGASRFAPNLIWYDDFKSHKQKQKAGKGGPTITDYTYTASCIFALCEGGNPATGIQGVGKVWKDKDTSATLSSLGMTLFPGTVPQAVWGYLTSKHPTKAFNYAGVAYLAVANYDLGNSATLPNHSFEVKSQRVGTGWTGGDDADCALIISDFLFNENYGVEMPAAAVDTAQLMSTVNAGTTGDASYQTYCRAMGFGLSPVLTDQKEAGSVLDQWCRVTNTAIVWTGYCLRFVPYCYENVVGNAVTFVPNTTPVYNLTDDDYLSKTNPVQVSRKDPSDCHNQLKLIYLNRANDYNEAPEPWEDQGLIEQFGKRPASDFTAKEITVQAMAVKAVTLMGKRGAYLRNTYTFQLGPSHVLLEPMDVVTVVDPQLGTVKVQITRLEEQDEGGFNCTAEEISAGVSTPSSYTPQTGGSNPVNTGAAPGSVNTPVIFEPPADLSKGSAQIWAAVSGGNNAIAGQYWGGCAVYVSADGGASYQAVGRIDSPARQGKLSAALAAYPGANPDVTNTAKVDLRMSEGELVSVTSTEAANATTLCYVGGEFISFETATLTATNQYDLTGLYRGLYNSTPGLHAIGAAFARLDENVFEYDLPADYVGVPLKFKFPSFNIWGGALQDLSACVEYSYTPDGNGFKIDPPSSTGLAFTRRTQSDGTSIITGTITLGPSDGPYLDHYDVQVSVSPYTTWIDVPAIGASGTKTSFEPAIASTNYKARARAVSSAPDGIPSAWVESAATGSGGLESAVPNVPTSLIATGGTLSNALSVTPPAAGAPVAGYRWYAIHAATGSFGSAVLIGQTQIPSFTHVGLGVLDTWRYWVVAYNSVGNSTEVGPQNATTGSGGGGGGDIDVEENDVPIASSISTLNFKGDGVSVSDAGGGTVDIQINGANEGVRPNVRGISFLSTSASSADIPLPVGSQVGDFAVLSAAGGWDPNIPTGWTSFDYLTGTNISGRSLYRNLSSGDIANGFITVTFGGSFAASIGLVVFEGPTNGVGPHVSGRSASSTGTRALSLSSDVTDVAVVFGHARGNGAVTLSPITASDGAAVASGSGRIGYYDTPGGTINETLTFASDTQGNYGMMVVVRGAPGVVPEAPLDGQQYVRENGAWVVNSGGSGSIDIEQDGSAVALASTLNFTGDGVTVTDSGGGVVEVEISGGGGGSGGGSYTPPTLYDFGAEANLITSGSAFASKGSVFTTIAPLVITGVTAVMASQVSGATYVAKIVQVNTSTLAITAILATSGTINPSAAVSTPRQLVFPLAAPLVLPAGARIAIVISRTDSTGTYVLPIMAPNTTFIMNTVPIISDGFVTYNTTTLTVAQTANTSSQTFGDGYGIGLVWQPAAGTNVAAASEFAAGVPALSSFTLDQDGTSSVVEAVGSAIVLTSLTGTTKVYSRPAPTTAPYRIAIALTTGQAAGAVNSVGFIDPVSKKHVRMRADYANNRLYVQKFSNLTTYNSDILDVAWLFKEPTVWFGLRDDGTTVYYEWSPDGKTFQTIASELKSTGYLAGTAGYSWPLWGTDGGTNVVSILRTWNASALNVSYTGSSGNSGVPWWWKPPAASEFPTLVTATASSPTVTDDPDTGMSLNWVGSTGSNSDDAQGCYKALPAGVDWQVDLHFNHQSPPQNYRYGGFSIRNSVANKSYTFAFSQFTANQVFFVLGQTGNTGQSVNSNIWWNPGPIHLRAKWINSTTTLEIWASVDGKRWSRIYSVLSAAFLGGAPNLIGFKAHCSISGGISDQQFVICDRWVQSW